MIINDKLLDDLLEQAKTNVRKRVNLDLRNGADDTSQRMLNALQPGSFVDIHRHPDTAETVVVLRGAVTEIFYDDKGVECDHYELSPKLGSYALQIPAGMWHTLIPREPSVIFEAKDGKYDLLLGTDIWSRE